MIFLTIAGGVGITILVKYGKPLAFIRSPLCNWSPLLNELFHCSLCLGTWIGALISPCLFGHVGYYALFLPPTIAIISWFVDTLIECMQTIILYLDHLREQTKCP